MNGFIGAADATRLLDVKPSTLYAYVSRGLVRSIPGSGKRKLYSRDDIERLRRRSEARAGHAAVASAALNFGPPVLDSAITRIEAEGPRYRGRLATQMAAAGVSFERVAELLWTGELPDSAVFQVQQGSDAERKLRELVPRKTRPIAWLSTLVPVLGVGDRSRFSLPDAAEMQRAQGIIVRCAASLVGCETDDFDCSQGLARAMVTSFSKAPSAEAERLLNRALVVVADHELNVSTFAARASASTEADLYACFSAALAALSGPRHGGACDRVEALATEVGKAKRAEKMISERARRGEDIPGFGHPLYQDGDPRARVLLDLIDQEPALTRNADVLLSIRDAMAATQRGQPNVDLALVAVCAALRWPLFAAAGIFALGRMAGWAAHVLEQRQSGSLMRPRARVAP